MPIVVDVKRLFLRDARKRARLTQDELATRSGVDQTTISHIECGRRTNPSFDTAIKLAKALDIAPSLLRFDAPRLEASLDRGSDRVVPAGRPTRRGRAA